MPKTKMAGKKKKKKEREVVYIRPLGRGKIDPRLIRKAVIAVRNRRLKEEAEAKAKAGAEANGDARATEAE
jgi:hypothetical protein